MTDKFTACVVGGGSGGHLSMNALVASDRFELLAAADLRDDVRQALKKEYKGIRTFASAEDMFKACPTDIVCISTYAPSHKELTLAALELPLKGILVEKPLGDSARAGREIIDAVRRRQLPMAVPHGLLVTPHSVRILEHLDKGDIGQLVLMEIECGGWDIINAGIHWFNFFVKACHNEPIHSVLASCDTSTRTYRDGMQVETEAITCVQTKSRIRAIMHTGDYVRTQDGKYPIFFRLVGTGGIIEFPGWQSQYRIQNAEHPDGKTFNVQGDNRAPHRVHLEDLAAQIDSGKPDYSVAESSQTALEICEAAFLSHQHRCTVTFPLNRFTPPKLTDWRPGQPYGGKGGGRDGRKLPPEEN